MNEVESVLDQLDRAYTGKAWHGPAVREVLAGLTAPMASAKPVSGAHSIWELVMHMGAWISAARRRLSGEPADLTPEEDWPVIAGGSEAAWQRTLAALDHEHNALREAISTAGHLQGKVAGREPSAAFLLWGVIQHNLYHAGQIAVIKKALAG